MHEVSEAIRWSVATSIGGGMMPMTISWVNPRTQKRETIYNYYDADTPEGEAAVESVRYCLSMRFLIPRFAIPGFRVENAEWKAPPTFDHSGRR